MLLTARSLKTPLLQASPEAGLHQLRLTNEPYSWRAPSLVSKIMGSTNACATRIRLNGSLCSNGNSATLAACSPDTARRLNPAGSIPSRTSRGLASSFPSVDLMLISQIEAALAYTSAASILRRTVVESFEGWERDQSSRCVSSNIRMLTDPRSPQSTRPVAH